MDSCGLIIETLRTGSSFLFNSKVLQQLPDIRETTTIEPLPDWSLQLKNIESLRKILRIFEKEKNIRDILKILRSRTLIALYCKVPNQSDKHEHQSKLTKFHQISPKLTKVSSNWQTFVVCIPF